MFFFNFYNFLTLYIYNDLFVGNSSTKICNERTVKKRRLDSIAQPLEEQTKWLMFRSDNTVKHWIYSYLIHIMDRDFFGVKHQPGSGGVVVI